MRLQAHFPVQHWQNLNERYWEHKWFEGLRLDSKSKLTYGICLIDLKLRHGKSDQSKYLLGVDLKLSNPRPDWQETPLIIEQYKAVIPCSVAPVSFCAHFPHRTITNFWLMIGIRIGD